MFSMEAMFAEQAERKRWEGVVAEWQEAYEQVKSQRDRHAREAEQWKQAYERLKTAFVAMRQDFAQACETLARDAGLALLLRRALVALDPTHPLVINGGDNELYRSALKAFADAYQDGEGGQKALNERIRQAVNAFPLPERPSRETPEWKMIALERAVTRLLDEMNQAKERENRLLDELNQAKEREKVLEAKGWEVVDDLCDHMAQREALRAELARRDPENPLVTNSALRRRISDAGRRAFAVSGGNWQAVKDAGLTFKLDDTSASGASSPSS